MSTLKVMVVDDHAVVRQGIRAVVEGAEGVEVVLGDSEGRTSTLVLTIQLDPLVDEAPG